MSYVVFKCSKASKFFNSNIHNSKLLQLGLFSSFSNNNNSIRNTKKPNHNKENQTFAPLFNEILCILGTDTITADKNHPFTFQITPNTTCPETVCKNAEEKMQMPSVCENGEEKINVEISSVLGNEFEDVSPIVHKVTAIVRTENEMEERLESADFEFNEEIVDKVLKRCFKVPHLGFRFFKWLKLGKGFEHTTNTFNTMIHVVGECKELNLVEGLVEEMDKSFCKKDVKTWSLLVSHYGRAKMIGKALMVFDKMKKEGFQPDAVAYRIMLRSLCVSRKSEIAMEFYKEMVLKEVEVDLGLYKQLLKCCALSGDSVSVRLVGDNMIRDQGIQERSVYVLMLKSFCISGRIREALELIRIMKNKGIDVDLEIIEILVKGFCRANRTDEAMEIVEIMKKRNIFDSTIYEVIINEFLTRNEVSRAHNLFQEVNYSAEFSISIYTNLMQSLLSNNEFQKATGIYNKVVEMGIQLGRAVKTSVAVGYLKQNRIHEAWEIITNINGNGVEANCEEFAAFVEELCKVPITDEVIKVLNEMQCSELNLGENVLSKIQSHLKKKREVLNSYSIDEAEPVDNQCDQESDSNQPAFRLSYNNEVQEVIQTLLSSTDWRFVQQMLENCHVHYTPDLVVEILCACRCSGGMALKFFSWVGKQYEYSHNARSYNMAMKIAGQGKDFEHMRSLFHEMRRRGCSITPETWTIIIMQYGRTGLTEIALTKFREMKLSGCKPTKSTYNSLITCLCGKKGRKIDEAISIYQEMVEKGFVPDKELVELYVGCLCESNKLSDVRFCIKSLLKFGYSIPLAYSLYFRALCRAGKLEEALALSDEVGSEKNILDQYTYGSLIHVLLRKGQLKEALAKMNSMKEIGVSPTVHVYTDLITYYFKAKEINKALETLKEMKGQNCHPTIVTYSALICGFVRSGRVTDAWDIFNGMKENGPFPDFKAYSMFFDCLCSIGKSEEALGLVTEMLHTGIVPSNVNFKKIMYGLNREGKQDLARVVKMKKLNLKQRRKMPLED